VGVFCGVCCGYFWGVDFELFCFSNFRFLWVVFVAFFVASFGASILSCFVSRIPVFRGVILCVIWDDMFGAF
jgi:hypothetical protein